ncbi:hypothetical protein BU17DRAFT_96926 [Hysterangium stoloniferum]|nr:hypothetical protein BU17DRAFT_96926 [Hysterangium stoloniferum]
MVPSSTTASDVNDTTITTIHIFPVEILQTIFLLIIPDYQQFLDQACRDGALKAVLSVFTTFVARQALRTVCTHWKAIIDTTPGAWSAIVFGTKHGRRNYPRNLGAIERRFNKAKGNLLDIFIIYNEEGSAKKLRQLMSVVVRYRAQVRALAVVSGVANFDLFRTKETIHFPQLTLLGFCSWNEMCIPSYSGDIDTPSLLHVFLPNSQLLHPLTASAWLMRLDVGASLETVIISHSYISSTLQNLEQCHNLRTLHWTDDAPGGMFSFSYCGPRINFPRLTSITILSPANMPICMQALQCIKSPSLERLSLQAGCEAYRFTELPSNFLNHYPHLIALDLRGFSLRRGTGDCMQTLRSLKFSYSTLDKSFFRSFICDRTNDTNIIGPLLNTISLYSVTFSVPDFKTFLQNLLQIRSACRNPLALRVYWEDKAQKTLWEEQCSDLMEVYGDELTVTGADLVADLARSGLPPLSQGVKRG